MALLAFNVGTGPVEGDLVNVSPVGIPLAPRSPARFYRVWRGPVELGRVVDWSDYDAGDRLFVVERLEGRVYVDTGSTAQILEDGVSLLCGEPLEWGRRGL